MINDAVNALLRLVRTSLRRGDTGVSAGHGFADPNYRPVRVPWVSVVGPVDVAVEPERDPPAPSDILVQLPGTLTGAPTAAVVPPGATLEVHADGLGSTTVTLAGGDLGNGDGPAVAVDVQAKLAAAIWRDEANEVITSPQLLASLQGVTARWTPDGRLLLISGRVGYVDALYVAPATDTEGRRLTNRREDGPIALSRVVVLSGSAREPLGLGEEDALEQPGRLLRERAPVPKAYALDVRLDLWTSSQHELAKLVEQLLRVVPTRGHLTLRPTLLADDVAQGASSIRLLEEGEPTLPISVVHLEATDGLTDRVSGLALDHTAGVTVHPTHVELAGTGTVGKTLWPAPLVPDPRRPAQFNPIGHALALGFSLQGASNNDTAQLAALTHDGRHALRLSAAVVQQGPDQFVDFTAEAELTWSGAWSSASTVRRLPLSAVEAGVLVHIAVSARRGAVSIGVDGLPQDLDDLTTTPTPPIRAPGRPAGGDDTELVIGDPGGSPFTVHLEHLHLLAEPVPPIDARARTKGHGARGYAPGDRIELSATTDGRLPAHEGEVAHVLGVDADTVLLDRPLTRAYTRGQAMAFSRTIFMQQRQLKRRDDLRNRLFRLSATYRLSALLEETATSVAGGLVLDPQVELISTAPPVPSHRGPATRGEDGPARPPQP